MRGVCILSNRDEGHSPETSSILPWIVSLADIVWFRTASDSAEASIYYERFVDNSWESQHRLGRKPQTLTKKHLAEVMLKLFEQGRESEDIDKLVGKDPNDPETSVSSAIGPTHMLVLWCHKATETSPEDCRVRVAIAPKHPFVWGNWPIKSDNFSRMLVGQLLGKLKHSPFVVSTQSGEHQNLFNVKRKLEDVSSFFQTLVTCIQSADIKKYALNRFRTHQNGNQQVVTFPLWNGDPSQVPVAYREVLDVADEEPTWIGFLKKDEEQRALSASELATRSQESSTGDQVSAVAPQVASNTPVQVHFGASQSILPGHLEPLIDHAVSEKHDQIHIEKSSGSANAQRGVDDCASSITKIPSAGQEVNTPQESIHNASASGQDLDGPQRSTQNTPQYTPRNPTPPGPAVSPTNLKEKRQELASQPSPVIPRVVYTYQGTREFSRGGVVQPQQQDVSAPLSLFGMGDSSSRRRRRRRNSSWTKRPKKSVWNAWLELYKKNSAQVQPQGQASASPGLNAAPSLWTKSTRVKRASSKRKTQPFRYPFLSAYFQSLANVNGGGSPQLSNLVATGARPLRPERPAPALQPLKNGASWVKLLEAKAAIGANPFVVQSILGTQSCEQQALHGGWQNISFTKAPLMDSPTAYHGVLSTEPDEKIKLEVVGG